MGLCPIPLLVPSWFQTSFKMSILCTHGIVPTKGLSNSDYLSASDILELPNYISLHDVLFRSMKNLTYGFYSFWNTYTCSNFQLLLSHQYLTHKIYTYFSRRFPHLSHTVLFLQRPPLIHWTKKYLIPTSTPVTSFHTNKYNYWLSPLLWHLFTLRERPHEAIQSPPHPKLYSLNVIIQATSVDPLLLSYLMWFPFFSFFSFSNIVSAPQY